MTYMLNVRTLRLSETLIQRLQKYGRTTDVPLGMADGIPGPKQNHQRFICQPEVNSRAERAVLNNTNGIDSVVVGKVTAVCRFATFLIRKEHSLLAKLKTGQNPAAPSSGQ